jgi:hypothetical protein
MSPNSPTVCQFYEYQNQQGAAAANRLLLGWLSDDKLRAELYADMIATKSALHFTSNAEAADRYPANQEMRDFDWGEGPRRFHQPAVLLAHPDHIEVALAQSNTLPQNAGGSKVMRNLQYSNSAYRGLGGYFMLGLDDPAEHDAQRDFALHALQTITTQQYDALATLAFKTGALGFLKSAEFDLAAMAENIAIRYVCMAFGFGPKDLALLEDCTRKIGRGLEYQNMGRHFVLEPLTMLESRQAVALLAQRATAIMSLYVGGAKLTKAEQDEKDELDTELRRIKNTKFRHYGRHHVIDGTASLAQFVPIMQWMVSPAAKSDVRSSNQWSLSDRGLIAAGLIGGSVTNIQNAICIIMSEWMSQDQNQQDALKKSAVTLRNRNPDARFYETDTTASPKVENFLNDNIKTAMRRNPPAAYIPRRANKTFSLHPVPTLNCAHDYILKEYDTIKKDTLVLIGLGGASGVPPSTKVTTSTEPPEDKSGNLTAAATSSSQNITGSASAATCPFAKVFGGAPLVKEKNSRATYTHSCPGMMMSMNVIDYTMRQLILLPSLSESWDPKTRALYGLQKRWGVQCVSYPMRYQREKWLVQTPLQTVLPIKAPVSVYSQQLRDVIRLGAPLIEKVLRDANHVHFASFMFLEDDSKLVLFTMYDGDFDSYIAHFAREFSYLFDAFFSCIAVPPPMPIREHPDEFVQYLKQFSRPPVEGYYFSAYPKASVSQIVHTFAKPSELVWQTEKRE